MSHSKKHKSCTIHLFSFYTTSSNNAQVLESFSCCSIFGVGDDCLAPPYPPPQHPSPASLWLGAIFPHVFLETPTKAWSDPKFTHILELSIHYLILQSNPFSLRTSNCNRKPVDFGVRQVWSEILSPPLCDLGQVV